MEIFERSFSRTGAKVSNLIPSDGRDASKPIFKRKLRGNSIRYSFGYIDRVLQRSQEKYKTILMRRNFGVQARCVLGDVQMANN